MALTQEQLQQVQQLGDLIRQRNQMTSPTKPVKPLSAEASKLSSITKTVQGEIETLMGFYEQNYKKSVAGIVTGTDRELVKLADQIADKIGRLRSGGAINKEEEARFMRQIASKADLLFGDKESALRALEGYLEEAKQVANSIQPTQVSGLQLSPELQAYIQSRLKQKPVGVKPEIPLTKAPSPVEVPAEVPAEIKPSVEPSKAEKILKILAIPSLGAGKKIGEAIGTVIARRRLAKEFPELTKEQVKEFVGEGPTPKQLAFDLLDIGLTLTGSGFLGKLGIKVGAKVAKGADELAYALEKTNLRLTPSQKTALGEKLRTITDYTSRFTGNAKQRFTKVQQEIELTENKLQSFFRNIAKGKTVNKAELVQDLNNIKSKYAFDRDIITIEKQIDGAIKTISRFGRDIPVDKLNIFKRTTFKNAYNQAGTKVLNDVEFEIADVAKSKLENAVKGLKVDGKDIALFNRNYGTKIEAGKLLRIAAGRPEVGAFGKLIGALAGGTIGATVAGPAGAAAGVLVAPTIGRVVAGTAVRGAVGRGLRKLFRSKSISKSI